MKSRSPLSVIIETYLARSHRPSACLLLTVFAAAALSEPMLHAQTRIGVIAPLSGPRASIGEDARAGAALALENILADSSEKQCPIVLNFEDSKGEPASGIAAFEKLTAAGTKMIITQNSGISLPISPLANRAEIIQLAISTTSDAYSSADDFTFRTNGGTIFEARVLARYTAGVSGEKRSCVAILTMEDEYPQSLRRNLLSEMRRLNVDVCLDDSFGPGERDFRSFAARISAHRASIAACLGYQTECGMLLKQLRRVGRKSVQFVGVTPVNNREFFETAGAASEGAAVSYIKVNGRHPAARQFLTKYGREVNLFSANAYDAVELLNKALGNCNCRAETRCLKDELFRIKNYHGLSGDKGFDDHFGDMQDEYEILVARNGSFARENGS